MSYAQNLWLYFALLFGIIIVPGMDMFFVMANTLLGGWQRGLMATAGIMLAGVLHTLFAAFFTGVIAAAVPGALRLILFAGALYMAWIGATLLRSAITVDGIGTARGTTAWAAFR